MGDLIFFLVLQIKKNKYGIFICQRLYVKDLLKKYNMDQCKSANTLMSVTISLDKDLSDKIKLLLYKTTSRPDIIFNVFFPRSPLVYLK